MRFTQAAGASARPWAAGWRAELAIGALFALVFALLVAFLSPWREFPINDDWVHAQAVRDLLNTGRLRLPGVTALTLVFNIYWGALFAWLAGGLSFTALRFSTLVLSLAGVLGFYALLRQLRVQRAAAVLGALVLLFNPLYLYLSYTFMTDVPFVALMILALVAYLRGLRCASARWLIVGSAFAALAFLSRQPGLALPGAAAAGLLLSMCRPPLKTLAAAVALPLAVGVLYFFWLNFIHGVPWVQMTVKAGGVRAFLSEPGALSLTLSRALVSLPYLGLWASPFLAGRAVTAAGARPWRLQRAAGISAAGIALCTGLIWYAASQYAGGLPYLVNVINWNGLGTQPLLGTKPSVYPAWLNPMAEWIGIPAGGWLAWRGVQETWAALRGRQDAALAVVILGGLLVTSGYFVLQDFYDRYLLALAPAAIVLAASGRPLSRLGHAGAWLALAALAAYSLAGEADHLEWNEARWQAGNALVAQGTPPEAIDGGYEWIGWHEYENAPNPPELVPGEAPPHDFDKHYYMHLHPRTYWLAFSPVQGYRVYSVTPYGSRGRAIYVLTAAEAHR